MDGWINGVPGGHHPSFEASRRQSPPACHQPPAYLRLPSGKSAPLVTKLIDNEFIEYKKDGTYVHRYLSKINIDSLPPVVIDDDNNVIFDYYNIINIARHANLKIINCIVKN